MIPSFDFSNALRYLGLGWVRLVGCSPIARRIAICVAVGGVAATVSNYFVPFYIPVPSSVEIQSSCDSVLWAVASYCLHFDYLVILIHIADRVFLTFPTFYAGVLLANYLCSVAASNNKAMEDSIKPISGR